MQEFADKKSLREHYLNLRSGLFPEIRKIREEYIFNKLYEIINLKQYNVIHSFIGDSDRGEFPTLTLINKLIREGKTVCGPRMSPGRRIDSYRIQSADELQLHAFGVLEPAPIELIPSTDIDLIIVPLLIFDKNNQRLGYGGGYYDRYLPSCPKAYKIGLSYFPPVDEIPGLESTDVSLDEVVWME